MTTPTLLCDAHLHLQDPRLSGLAHDPTPTADAPQSLQVVNGTCEQDWGAVASLADKPGVLPAFGLHPWFLRCKSDVWKQNLEARLDHHPHALIGEIGLDRWVRDYDFEDQKTSFRVQLTLARERMIPPTIHCLKAWGSLIEHLESLAPWSQGFLLHSFSGPAEIIPRLIALGGYFSLSGSFAHPGKTDRLRAWATIPMDRMLIETDAPNMMPPETMILKPAYDQNDNPINHPDNLSAIYAWAAQWRGLEAATFSSQVWSNVLALFGKTRVTMALGRTQ